MVTSRKRKKTEFRGPHGGIPKKREYLLIKAHSKHKQNRVFETKII